MEIEIYFHPFSPSLAERAARAVSCASFCVELFAMIAARPIMRLIALESVCALPAASTFRIDPSEFP